MQQSTEIPVVLIDASQFNKKMKSIFLKFFIDMQLGFLNILLEMLGRH